MSTTAPSFNRTGMEVDPDMAAEMEEVPELTQPSSEDISELMALRAEAFAEAAPMGSLPEVNADGNRAAVAILLDKLGDRLAFERSGTRLYELLAAKLDVLGSFRGGPSKQDAQHIADEELEHFEMLMAAIVALDGDPTMLTPAANLSGVISKGIPEAVADPRTNVGDCLEALLVAELTDNQCWESLILATQQLGYDDLVEGFNKALAQEREHLQQVRSWRQAYDLNLLSNAEFADEEWSEEDE